MLIYKKKIQLNTKGNFDIIDITGILEDIVKKSNVSDGILVVELPGSTGAITTIEYHSTVIADIKKVINKLIPKHDDYQHDRIDDNAHSHVRAAIFKPSLSLIIEDGKLIHGTWQQVVFIDFDSVPRNRTLHVLVMGTK